MNTLSVLGAGAWGTALALHAARRGHAVKLWFFGASPFQTFEGIQYNTTYLPNTPLPPSIEVTEDPEKACEGSDFVLFASPSNHMRSMALRFAKALPPTARIVVAAKGLEETSLQLMSQVLTEALPNVSPHQQAFLSGPSFAKEVAEELATRVVVASTSPTTARAVQEALHTDRFCIYTSADPVGVQIGGALKNVVAIAAGLSDGLHLGYNARVALMNRGLIEMTRLGVALGANPLTFLGLSGMGDLVLTCTGDLSRNRMLGLHVAQGGGAHAFLASRSSVTEGFGTSQAAYALAKRQQIDMPVTRLVYQVLHEEMPPQEAMEQFLQDPCTTEFENIF